ncbi:MAG: hypothetical protein NVS4B7_01790 [Ktedonobacteraceae bacterium]
MSIDESALVLQRGIVRQWIAAFNAHEVATIVALYAHDAELYDAGMRYGRRGKKEIERWFTKRFQTMPSIAYTPKSEIFDEGDGGQAAVTWTTVSKSPRLWGQAWLSRPLQVDGVSIFTFRNGLIQRQRGYYDHLAVLEQVLPPLRWILPSRL